MPPRAAEQRDELAAFYLIEELHFGPRARAGLLGYRTGGE